MLDQTPTSPDGDAYAAPVPEVIRHQPEFSGRAGEYFGIWIVNVLLGIVTLGIYSAWAKVRTERYFYGNTRLAGSAFEYLADPVRILKGRLIAYAVVIALALSYQFLPVLYLFLILGVFLCTPLLVFLGTRFRARYSAWRGLRFRFANTAGRAYGPFLGWSVLSAVTLSLLYPLMKQRQHEYVVGGHRFGGAAFHFEAPAGPYYVPYVIALVGGVSVFVLVMLSLGAGVALFAPGQAAVQGGDVGQPPGAVFTMMMTMLILLYAAFFALLIFLRTRYVNLMWNHASLGPHRFESTLRPGAVIWLYASNLVVILCTLGLAVPWAMVRLARYRAAHFALLASGSVDAFMADLEAEHGAAGAELVDALDLGVDIGL